MNIHAVYATEDTNRFVVDLTVEIRGIEERTTYLLDENDPYGIAPQVREAIQGFEVQPASATPKPKIPSETNEDRMARVNIERDKRISNGFIFKNTHFQSDDVSRNRIEKAKTSALAAIVGGAQPGDFRWHGEDVDFFFIATDDTRVPMDAQTMLSFGIKASAWEGLHIASGSDIKNRIKNGETDLDIKDDSLWPPKE